MKRLLLIILLLLTVILAVAAVFIGYRISQQELGTENTEAAVESPFGGDYTNLYGCGPWPCTEVYTGSYCNTALGSCNGAHIFSFTCEGRSTNCLEQKSYQSSNATVSGTSCGQTVELNVFDKKCDEHESGWDPECNLLDYLVWYSGECIGNETPTISTPSPTIDPEVTPTGVQSVSSCENLELNVEVLQNNVSVRCVSSDDAIANLWRAAAVFGEYQQPESQEYFQLAVDGGNYGTEFRENGWEFSLQEPGNYTVGCFLVDINDTTQIDSGSDVCTEVVTVGQSIPSSEDTPVAPQVEPVCVDQDSRVNISWAQLTSIGQSGYNVIIDNDENSTNGELTLSLNSSTTTSTQGPNGFASSGSLIESNTFASGETYNVRIAYLDGTAEVESPRAQFSAIDCSTQQSQGGGSCGSNCDPADPNSCSDPSRYTCQDGGEGTGTCVLIDCVTNPSACDASQCSLLSPLCGQACDPTLSVDPCSDLPNPNSCVNDGTGNGFCVLDLCIVDPAACEADLCTPILPKTSLFNDNTWKIVLAGSLILFGILFYKSETYDIFFKYLWNSKYKKSIVKVDRSMREKYKKDYSESMEDL